MTLHPDTDFDARGAGRRQPLAQEAYPLLGDAGDRGHPIRRELADALPERLPAEGVAGDELVVLGPGGHHAVHQAKRKGRVGSGDGREVLVGALGAAGSDRVYGDEAGAFLAGGVHKLPEVVTGGERVGSPQHDEPRLREGLGVHPHAVVAQYITGSRRSGDHADAHQVLRGSQHVS